MTSEVILPSAASGVPTSLRPRKRYPAYRDSGVDWLGEIPKHWDVRKLKYLAKVTASNVDKHSFEGEKTVRLCNYVHVYCRDYITADLDFMEATATAAEIARFKLERGDVIVTKDSESWDDIAVPAFVQSQMCDVLCGYHLALIRPKSMAADGHYLFRGFAARGINDQFRVAANGITRYGLGKDRLGSGWFPLPPLPEQRAIADFLDRETAKIDALVAKRERLIDLLEEKRAAVIAHAVTKGLDPNVPTKDSGIQWLGEIPAHWEVKRLMYLTQPGRPIMYGIVLPGPNVDEGVLIVKGGDVAPGRLRPDLLQKTTAEIEAGYVRSRLRPGDIVYAIRGSIGAAERIPPELDGANLTQDAARVAPGAAAQGEWLLWALKSRSTFGQLEAGALGATIRGINIRDLKRAFLPVPAGNEQRSIAEYLGRETSQVGTLIARVLQHIDKLREFRTALISAAVTGKIDVRSEV